MPALHFSRRQAVLVGSAAGTALLWEESTRGKGFEVAAPAANRLVCALQSVASLAAVPAAQAQSVDPSIQGQWSSVLSWPITCVHTHVLPSGRIMTWSSYLDGDTPTRWDPAGNTFTSLAHANYNIFCSGHTVMADGRVFVAGGHIAGASGDPQGFPYAKIYDPTTNVWTSLPNMNAGRWYPTAITLPTGDVLVASGTTENGIDWNTLPQIWKVATGTWLNLTGAQADGLLPWYPHMYVAPNGKVYYCCPEQRTAYLDTSGGGSWSPAADHLEADRGWTGYSSVMYDTGKIMVVGGGDVDLPPSQTAEITDLTDPSPTWRYTGWLNVPRRQHNTTVLPDGTVLVTGGHTGAGQDDPSSPVYNAEIWDPTTGAWTSKASASVFRGYHSVALLLPDGRVLSAGGDDGGSTAEVYSPPYLFRGTRPVISNPPVSVRYGQAAFVGTPDAATIARVTWISLPSVTHSYNFNQRLNRLSFVPAAGGLMVTPPANPNLAPPGYYMLFLLNGRGVPSVGAIVRLQA